MGRRLDPSKPEWGGQNLLASAPAFHRVHCGYDKPLAEIKTSRRHQSERPGIAVPFL